MAFSLIKPMPKKTRGISITCKPFGKGGGHILRLSMPSAVFGMLFSDRQTFDLLIGDGNDKGKLMIKPNATGTFKVKMMKYTAIFALPATEWTPQAEFATDDLERRELQDGSIVVTLPDWVDTWKDILAARKQVARERELESTQIGKKPEGQLLLANSMHQTRR